MNLRPATNDPRASTWGSFALVTYLPDPLGSFLTELRHLLPGETRPEAHITFLPPRRLALPLDIASEEIRRILDSVKPFPLELGTVRVFPDTNILYLSVEAGHQELLHLHHLLNSGKLFAQEHFEYIPHLTLGGPLAWDDVEDSVRHAQYRWENAGLPQSFVVKEMVLLWQPDNCQGNDWRRISAHPLKPVVTQTWEADAL